MRSTPSLASATDDRTELEETRHRCRNALQLIGSLARIKLREAASPETRDALEYIGEFIDVVGELQKRLDTRRGDLDLSAHIDACGPLWQGLCGAGVTVTIETCEPLVVPGRHGTNISLIVHELVLNAIKHAFPDGRSGTIGINIARTGPDHVTVTVADDGVGAGQPSPGLTRAADDTHMGSALVRSLAAAIGGTVERGAAGGPGHGVSVRVPVEVRQ